MPFELGEALATNRTARDNFAKLTEPNKRQYLAGLPAPNGVRRA
ncbi:MAG: hypothetical protein QF432_05230 [Dehalococcoidales bacterium]|nr:hypothetical protein [Dehalococcoidales bacterium]